MAAEKRAGLRHVAINGWFAGDHGSGSGQYLHHMLAALAQAAPQVEWSLLLPAGTRAPGIAGVRPVEVTLPRLPRPLRKLWWEQVAVPQAAGRLSAQALWVPYWAAPWRSPLPVVVTVHDLIPLLLPEYRRGLLQRAYTALVSTTARRAAAVITVSHASGRDIITHLGIPGERVHVVWHGANQEGSTAAEPVLADVRSRLDLPARYFLYLGGFDARKNLRTLLQGYRRYLDRGGDAAVKLVIGGKLPARDGAFAPDPVTIAAALNLGEQVRFLGWVDETDKPALYAMATAFLFPSLYEGFGMMVLEAMQAGAPVLTSSNRQQEPPRPEGRGGD